MHKSYAIGKHGYYFKDYLKTLILGRHSGINWTRWLLLGWYNISVSGIGCLIFPILFFSHSSLMTNSHIQHNSVGEFEI